MGRPYPTPYFKKIILRYLLLQRIPCSENPIIEKYNKKGRAVADPAFMIIERFML